MYFEFHIVFMVSKVQRNVQNWYLLQKLYPYVNKEQLKAYTANEDKLQHKNSEMLGDVTSPGAKDDVLMISILRVLQCSHAPAA